MTLADRPRLRIFTLCVLYVAQGIPYGFTGYALAAWLTKRGLTAEALAATLSMTTIPWSFKWVWGPLLDRFTLPRMGRRRPWILAAQTGMIATVALMGLIPDPSTELRLVAWMIFAHNVFSALQDVATDALAVDLLSERERGRANGLMIGSKYVGTMIGGAALGEVVASAGLPAAFGLQVSILATIILLPLLVRERAGDRLLSWPHCAPGDAPPRGGERGPARSLATLFAALARAFALRSPALAGVVAVSASIASMGIVTIAPLLYLKRLGWAEQDYTRLAGGAGVAIGLVGSVVGGFLADVIGARRLAAAACALLALDWIGFALLEPWWTLRLVAIGGFLAAALLAAILEVALLSLFMTMSWPRIAATQFTAYMALINVSNTIGIRVIGPLEAHLGWRGLFLAAGLFQLSLPLLLPLIDPGQTRRELGE